MPAFQAGDTAKLKDLDGQSDKLLTPMETVTQQMLASYQAEAVQAKATADAAQTAMLWMLLGSALAATVVGIAAGVGSEMLGVVVIVGRASAGLLRLVRLDQLSLVIDANERAVATNGDPLV